MAESLAANREPWSVRAMRELVVGWLDGHPIDGSALENWLGGESLPPVGDHEPPYLWVLRGLPLGAARAIYEPRLAERVAQLLRDGDGVAKRSLDWRFNLLKLAAGLGSADHLQEPLHALLVRRLDLGTLNGVPLTQALMEALRENQGDNRYRSLWLNMLAGRPDAYLGGNVFDGFWGVLWMPESAHSRGRPAIKEVIDGLLAVALTLNADTKRREREFRYFVNCVLEAYQNPAPWSDPLLGVARDVDCPRWARPILHEASIVAMPVPVLASETKKRPELLALSLERITLGASPDTLGRYVDELAEGNPAQFITHAERSIASVWKRLVPTLADRYEFELRRDPELTFFSDAAVIKYQGQPLNVPEDVASSPRILDRAIASRTQALPKSSAGVLRAARALLASQPGDENESHEG